MGYEMTYLPEQIQEQRWQLALQPLLQQRERNVKHQWLCDNTTMEESGVGQQMCFLWYRSAVQDTGRAEYKYSLGNIWL